MDFMVPSVRQRKEVVEIYPSFRVVNSKDLMTRGGDFYAIWDEENQTWSTDKFRAQELIDLELYKKLPEVKERYGTSAHISVLDITRAETGSIDSWIKFCTKQMPEHFKMLDDTLVFENTPVTKELHSSHKLKYALSSGNCPAWDKLVSTLYKEEERLKIEWAIGAVVTGDAKKIQKFLVFYGEGGAGKSTILNVIEKLFEGYTAVFDAKALGDSNQQFSLEAFSTNPLVAIQHDGDLSRIEDNTKLNSLVSHEKMRVNGKYQKLYSAAFGTFLFMASNKPVKITDSKSGLFRRLIDVHPSGEKLPRNEYNRVVKQIEYELGAIAWHCKEVYEANKTAFDAYQPTEMALATNDIFNFVFDNYDMLEKEDGISLSAAYELYKKFAEDTGMKYPLDRRSFANDLTTYFVEHKDRCMVNGLSYRNYYIGFRKEKFDSVIERIGNKKDILPKVSWIILSSMHSILDDVLKDCPAQESVDKKPSKKWDKCDTKLLNIDSRKEHFVRPPENMIVIDLDLKDENGEKCLEKNLKRAADFPPTYVELSKSGGGVHLHYWYDGDVTMLQPLIEEDVEIKTFTGKSSLRRKLSQCNDISIATISSGLPKKEVKKLVNDATIKDEQHLRNIIVKCLQKKIHPDTRSNIDMINKVLNDAYESGIVYDLSDLKKDVYTFAARSTHQYEYCTMLVGKMHFQSEREITNEVNEEAPIAFYDVEIVPNLFYISWKEAGPNMPMHHWFNPSPEQIDILLKYRLIGFNCRNYDNHTLWGRKQGYNNRLMYELSKSLISNDTQTSRNARFGMAYNLSYLDLFEMLADKHSLKWWEIELGLPHLEWDMSFDEDLPEELWPKLAEYCDKDVYATEAVFNANQPKYNARLILSALSGLAPNDTQNSHTERIIFMGDKHPQKEFFYRDLSKPIMREEIPDDVYEFIATYKPDILKQTYGPAHSILPYFEGYEFVETKITDDGKVIKGGSYYMDEDVKNGGRVYAEHGMYTNVGLLDATSMHPNSIISECHFGPRYTKRYLDLVLARVAIKHKAWDEARTMLDGALIPFIEKIIKGEIDKKSVADALKIAINAVYGLTSARFANAFLDPRNRDNFVAKRGALFMTMLCQMVKDEGYQVAHIKTDSIKIPNADKKIIAFVQDTGRKYGYNFEHEATYDRMCLVNNSTYIARFKTKEACERMYGYSPEENTDMGGQWTATGAQFAVPYVFKTLFSKEKLEFNDFCWTFQSRGSVGPIVVDICEDLPDVSDFEKELDKLETKYKKGLLSDTMFESEAARLNELIAAGHDYRFIGKVGQFCPVKTGVGGGIIRKHLNATGKYAKVAGAGDYIWMETETIHELQLENAIDDTYFRDLDAEAIKAINEFGDFEWFVSEDEAA